MQFGIVAWILLALGVVGFAAAIFVGGAGAAILAVVAIALLLMGVLTASTE
jgi:hypothetical protein